MIYDFNTRNISFLKIARDLRQKGVKNSNFMLALYDEGLVGVDPFSENLSEELKIRIWKEIVRNQWYYLREVVRVPVDGVHEGVQYQAHLGNMAITYTKSFNLNIAVLMPRQFGKTMGQILFDSWILMFSGVNTNMIYSNKEFRDAKKNLKIIKDIRERLPFWLQELIKAPGDRDNLEDKVFSLNNNTLKAVPAANSEESADKLGRGLTTSNIMFDEFAFLARNETIYAAAYPAFAKAAENAKKNGTPYGISIITTPNNADIPQGAYAKQIYDNAAPFILECFDMDEKELREYIKHNSTNDFIKLEFSYKELGRDDAWLEQMTRNMQGDLLKIRREFLLVWPISSDNSVFSEDLLVELESNVIDPVEQLKLMNYYYFDFYEKIDFLSNYIISVDVAGGLGRDNTAITISAADDFRIVGDFKNNKITIETLTELLEHMMLNIFPNAILIVERNSYGLAVIQKLMTNSEIERRMYRELRKNVGTKSQRDGVNTSSSTKNYIYGVDTTSKSRDLMFELLPDMLKDESYKFRSKKFFNDISGLQRNGRKIEHRSGGHDDNLMSYLIFRYALHYGTGLRDRFGISAISSPSNLRRSGNRASPSVLRMLSNATSNNPVELIDVPNIVDLYSQEEKINPDRNSSRRRAVREILDLNKWD